MCRPLTLIAVLPEVDVISPPGGRTDEQGGSGSTKTQKDAVAASAYATDHLDRLTLFIDIGSSEQYRWLSVPAQMH